MIDRSSRPIGSRIAVLITLLVTSGAQLGVGAEPAAAEWPGATALFRLTDPRISEASGLAAGITSPGVLYVQNDSGDSARFFALDAHAGSTRATYEVPGATNVDWEDLAVAPDRRGVPSVWLADLGDNEAQRGEVQIYRVDEPHVSTGNRSTGPPDVWRLRYPSGAVDAEGLAVGPDGAGYVFTKSLLGATAVYAVPRAPDPAHVQQLRQIGTIQFALTGTAGGPNPVGQLTATGAALSRDGSLLAVRTYTDAYLWRVTNGDVAAALRAAPVRLALPRQPQGEGITIDAGRLVIDSEQVGSTVYSLRIPSIGSSGAPTPTPTATASTQAPARHDGLATIASIAGAVVLASLVGGWFWARGSRRAQRR